MKKFRELINTMYRVCKVNPRGRIQYISYTENESVNPDLDDSMLRQIIAMDPLPFEASPEIQTLLHQRVEKGGHPASAVKNSLLEIFLPLLSSRHIEIKMAVISIALFLMVGLGQKNNQVPDKKMHLFFLADTLGDSSSYNHPAAQDTAFRHSLSE